MGFKEGDFPPVDPDTFLERPFLDRIRVLNEHWVDYGFGTPKMVHAVYITKILVLYIGIGLALATFTSGLNLFHIGDWWNQPNVYQKAIMWTVLVETLGLAGSWGPLAGHFKPMTGGFLFWLRPNTIRLPPWPEKVPFTKGDNREIVDVAIYALFVINVAVAVVLPGVNSSSLNAVVPDNAGLINPVLFYPMIALFILLGLRDKVVFIAARAEQYLPAMVFFAFLPFVDMIIALKLLIVVVWMGAGISKLGHHFSNVIPPMISNTPWLASKTLKRANYRSFPNDLRPSKLGSGIGHVLGTIVEIVTPVVLLFSTNRTLTLAAVVLMVCFHLFIFSTFPLAVPLEWNLLFAYASVFLFWGFPAWDGFGVTDATMPWVMGLIVAALLFFPILGNLRPDLVSFLPSMRQYAGNWASGTWAFAPGAEAKIDANYPRPATVTRTQLLASYPPGVADVVMHQLLGFRAMHSQGRALYSLMMRHLGDDINTYDLREAEFACNSVVAFNFGDGHFHDEQLIAALQRRCNFAPGEFLVAWLESQPIHKRTQEYKVIDAALGVIETGTYRVQDAIDAQPWLPDGPIPFQIDSTLHVDARRALTDPEVVPEPKMREQSTRAPESTQAPRSAAAPDSGQVPQ